MDPSKELDDADWESANPVRAYVYKSGTLLWKDSSAYYKKEKDTDWISMRQTGQWTLESGYHVYLSGGEIRRKS